MRGRAQGLAAAMGAAHAEVVAAARRCPGCAQSDVDGKWDSGGTESCFFLGDWNESLRWDGVNHSGGMG